MPKGRRWRAKGPILIIAVATVACLRRTPTCLASFASNEALDCAGTQYSS
jgi:hypothetical protein